MPPERKPGKTTAIQGIVEVPGGRLAYETAGRGPPVLFLHSVIADRRMWDRQFSGFSSGHQVVRFDLRGFGGSTPASAPFSYVEDAQALISHLHLPKPFLVGSSMGGAFAIDLALQSPELVSGLLLAAPGLSGGFEPPFEPDEQAAFEYDERKSQEIAQAWTKGDSARAIELLRQLWCSTLEGRNLALFRNMVEQNASEVFDNRSMQHATAAPPAAGRLSSLRVPTTVLIGDRDNPSSVPFAKRIARSVPGARLVPVPGADHLVNLSCPDAFDEALRSALAAID